MVEKIKEVEVIEEELVEEQAGPLGEPEMVGDGSSEIDMPEEEESLPETVMVGDVEYNLFKTGAAQAKQVSDLLNWLGDYGEKLASVLVSDSEEGEEPASALGSTWDMISAIGKVSSPEALVDLFLVVIGCNEEEAEKYFSLNTLIDGVQVLLSQKEYAKVLNRFF